MAGISVDEAKQLITELCRTFYTQGWVSGTGGGISMRTAGGEIVMAPSGVQKERMEPSDMFVLDAQGNVLHTPQARPPPYKPPKLSECAPLFTAAYELRDAGAVMHSHSLNAVLATMLDPDATEFRVTHLEMIKGIEGHGFYGNCVVPIIENTARECELTDRMRAAIAAYPQANAVLVRRHGVYVWGRDWIQAKTQAECYDYLFEAAVRMAQLGISAALPPPAPKLAALEGGKRHTENGVHDGAAANGASAAKRPKLAAPSHHHHHAAWRPAAIVLDIEGTLAPISYVADVMFPHARDNVAAHLEAHFNSAEARADIEAIRQQAAADGGPAIPPITADKGAIIAAVVAWVHAAIAADRKVGALKQLQGHVWRAGFKKGQLVAQLFRDVPDSLVEWRNTGIKTYIYSSGSREAQRLFFEHSQAGDLRPFLCGFFDTTAGPKGEPASYANIQATLGVDDADQVLFATDVLAEAEAAAAAGWRAVLVSRPGNKQLPENPGFRMIESMQQLLAA